MALSLRISVKVTGCVTLKSAVEVAVASNDVTEGEKRSGSPGPEDCKLTPLENPIGRSNSGGVLADGSSFDWSDAQSRRSSQWADDLAADVPRRELTVLT
jgi:hypothetical protein